MFRSSWTCAVCLQRAIETRQREAQRQQLRALMAQKAEEEAQKRRRAEADARLDVAGHADARMAESVYARVDDAGSLGAQVEAAIAACAAPVRDGTDAGGSGGQVGRSEDAKEAGNSVPRAGIGPATRGVSVRTHRPGKPGKLLRNVTIVQPDGTRLYVRPARTLLELVDAALAV